MYTEEKSSSDPSMKTRKSFKCLEDEYTRKITEIMQSENCEKELAPLFNNRGHAKYMQVEFDSAVDDYDKALQYDPHFATAYFNRATVHYRLGNFQGAFHDMEKAIKLDPLNKEFAEGYNDCKRLKCLQG